MDGLKLLTKAHAAGLTVEARGNELVVKGPKRAEAIAKELLAHKAMVLAALAAATQTTPRQQPAQSRPRILPQRPTRADSPQAVTNGLQWPTRPHKMHHHILGRRLRWTDKSQHYRIEVFPEDGDPRFIVLLNGSDRVIGRCRRLRAAQSFCRHHFKRNERKSCVYQRGKRVAAGDAKEKTGTSYCARRQAVLV